MGSSDGRSDKDVSTSDAAGLVAKQAIDHDQPVQAIDVLSLQVQLREQKAVLELKP